MRTRVLLSVLALATGLIATHHSRHLTLADISVCGNCGASVSVDQSTAGANYNYPVFDPSNFNNVQP